MTEYRRSGLFAAVLGLCCTDLAVAQEREAPARGREATVATQDPTREFLRSGPEAGAKIAPLPVYAPVGVEAGREFDAAARLQRGPGAVLFVHELSRNTAPMIRAMDTLGDEFLLLGLRTAVVALGGDRNATEDMVGRASGSLRPSQPMWVSTDGAEGPGAWALSRRATLTLVLTRDGVVQSSRGLTDTGPGDVPLLRRALEEVCGGAVPKDPAERRAAALRNLPDDPEALRELAAEMALRVWQRQAWPQPQRAGGARPQPGMRGQPQQRPRPEGRMQPEGQPQRPAAEGERATGEAAPQGRAPDDPQLRELLRRIINRSADADALDAAFRDLGQHVGENADLSGQTRSMFQLMLRLDYGTADAKQRAGAWLKSHAEQTTAPAGGRRGN